MDRIEVSASITKLSISLRDGSAITVSGGSFFPLEKIGAYGWIVATEDRSEWIQGGGILPGDKQDQSSYKSELVES